MSILAKIKKHGLSGSYRIVKTILCKPFRPVIYSFFRLFPIREDLIIFESEPDYCDNAWALYRYLRDKGGYRFVWSVVNPSGFRSTKDTVFVSHKKDFLYSLDTSGVQEEWGPMPGLFVSWMSYEGRERGRINFL